MKSLVKKYIVGIDEVGRGALAGPVVVAAVCFPVGLKISNRKLGALKDSKKLSPKLRELWVEYFKSIPEISYKTARVYPRAIEKINISRAANKAAGLVAERLMKSLWQENTYRPTRHSGILSPSHKATDGQGKNTRMFRIFLDGGLFLGVKRGLTRTSRGIAQKFQRLSASAPLDTRISNGVNQRWSATTVVRGDEKITAVKVASIIAKVHRDKYMKKLSEKHPRYEFEIHKGYGTRRHISAIKKHGPSRAHRLTFIKKWHNI